MSFANDTGYPPVSPAEVKTIRDVTASDSSTRATSLTPTSGTRVQVLGLTAYNLSATAVTVEVYFGTGGNITTTPGNEIDEFSLDADIQRSISPQYGATGPVGDVDEVVSLRTSADITANVVLILRYREIN